jgi:hypothetical protein
MMSSEGIDYGINSDQSPVYMHEDDCFSESGSSISYDSSVCEEIDMLEDIDMEKSHRKYIRGIGVGLFCV